MIDDPNRSSSPSGWVRFRLAAGLALVPLLVSTMVVVVAAALAGGQGAGDTENTRAGLARVGDGVALVIVADDGSQAADARTDMLRWTLVAAAVLAIPAFGAGWLVAGRMLGSVDVALTDAEAAEDERVRRLQEVVHELRTPLAVMATNLELAATEPELDAGATEFVEAARRAVYRMGRTVDDLAGHGRLAVAQDERPVDLAAVAAALAAEQSGPAQARGVRIFLALAPPVEIPEANEAAVQTTLGNFLTNAIRLAPGGSVVEVCWGETANWAWAAISDEGPGLPDHLHARVFERGWRGAHERMRRGPEPRSGLGLTIARQLTEAQGGVVTLESDEGGGSTFSLWLPLNHRADVRHIVGEDGVHPAVSPWRKGLLPS